MHSRYLPNFQVFWEFGLNAGEKDTTEKKQKWIAKLYFVAVSDIWRFHVIETRWKVYILGYKNIFHLLFNGIFYLLVRHF